MAGFGSIGGMSSGPQAWWTLPGQDTRRGQLQQNAPSGYEYDEVKAGYNRTPEEMGGRAGRAISALRAQVPDLFAPNTSSSGSSGSSSGGGPAFPFPPPGSTGGGVPPPVQIQFPDTTAANQAIFNRAKDQVGQTSRSAITGLQSSLAGRGMLGSGMESRGVGNVVNQGQQQLGEVTREQAIQDAGNLQKQAETQYSGGITQRGQDIGVMRDEAGRQQSANDLALRAWIAQQADQREAERQAHSRSQAQSQSISQLLQMFGEGLY